MYNHDTNVVNECICITREFHEEVGEKIQEIMNENNTAGGNLAKTIEEVVKYMGSCENLDITKSVIAHLFMNLFNARANNPMAALAHMMKDD